MKPVFLSIGSNIEPELNVPACLKLLKEKFDHVKISPVYETDPVGPAGPQKFWNLAAEIKSDLGRKELTEKMREIEGALGRRRDPENKFAPRAIDIDILPQDDYQNQAFIMIPLADIAPEARDAKTGKTFEALAENLRGAAAKSMREINVFKPYAH